jgi:hypothetical protein
MIQAICTCAASQSERVPQLVDHYLNLGVDRFWLGIHFRDDDGCMESALKRLEAELPSKAVLLPPLVGDFTADLLRTQQDDLQAREIRKSDWVLWLDADEFQIYPAALRDVLDQADRNGFSAISGEMLDRSARDGSLPHYEPRAPIWEQYPVASNFTGRVLRAYSHKVVAARGYVRVSLGNHEATERRDVHFAPDVVAIHHFKWDDRVLTHLAPRLDENYKQRYCCWVETDRALEHIQRWGRINLEELATFDFGDGYHHQADTRAWDFVRHVRAGNDRWRARQGFLYPATWGAHGLT